MKVDIPLGLSWLCILSPRLLHTGTERLVRVVLLVRYGRNRLVVHLSAFHRNRICIGIGSGTSGDISIDNVGCSRGAGQGIIVLIFILLVRALLFGHHHGLDLGTEVLRLQVQQVVLALPLGHVHKLLRLEVVLQMRVLLVLLVVQHLLVTDLHMDTVLHRAPMMESGGCSFCF